MSKIAKIFGGGEKQEAPPPLPPVPTRADPAIAAAKKRQQHSAKMRKGRKASILTSGQGVSDGTGSSSQAGAKLLGE